MAQSDKMLRFLNRDELIKIKIAISLAQDTLSNQNGRVSRDVWEASYPAATLLNIAASCLDKMMGTSLKDQVRVRLVDLMQSEEVCKILDICPTWINKEKDKDKYVDLDRKDFIKWGRY